MAPRRKSPGPPAGANGRVEAFARGLVSWMHGRKHFDKGFDVMAPRSVLLPLHSTETHPE